MKKKNEKKDARHNGIANISAVAAVLLFGTISFIDILRHDAELSSEIMTGVCVAAALGLLLPFLRYGRNSSVMAFFIPLILFLFYTLLLQLNKWNTSYYLLASLCFCGISCMYSSFRMTVFYAVAQSLIIGLLVYTGIPIMGTGVPMVTILITLFISLFGIMIFILLSYAGAVLLGRAAEDQNSFRTLLSTTANYIAMVDASNRVVYASTPMSRLARIDNAEAVKGRPFLDLFPGRQLKLLVYKLLSQKNDYEDSWDFSINGQNLYFKAMSASIPGSSKGALISLHDMTHLAERDEIALMKDSLKIGLFFMNRELVIQDQYSRFLEVQLEEGDLFGKNLADILANSVTSDQLGTIKDYFNMIFDRTFDQATLKEINPLDELHYTNPNSTQKKVFHFDFAPVERGRGGFFLLVTVYDITQKIELQRRLLEEESKRQEEMKSLFEIIQVEPQVFSNFLEDVEYEFNRVDETLKKTDMSTHEVLVDIYQSVHSIKSNAVILGLNSFGNKVHELESKIKALREQEGEVPFNDMLNLTMDLEHLSLEKDGFKTTIEKINSYKTTNSGGQPHPQNMFIDSLARTVSKAAGDMEKKIRFVADGVNNEAVEKGPKRLMKEVVMQLIRNSVVHGIEKPEDRIAKGKNETGTIRLSIKYMDDKIHVRLEDDGGGLNYKKISEKALGLNLIKKEDENNKDVLLKTIFSPGFSTAENEGVHAGRGIGLNLVRDRVREGGGTIKVQTLEGKGTAFNLFFPKTSEA